MLWYWTYTKEIVERSAWDNIDYMQTDFPYMQDAVALNIYTHKVLYRIFVSSNMVPSENGFFKDSKKCERKQVFRKNHTCRIGLYKCAGKDEIIKVRINQSGIFWIFAWKMFIGEGFPVCW